MFYVVFFNINKASPRMCYLKVSWIVLHLYFFGYEQSKFCAVETGMKNNGCLCGTQDLILADTRKMPTSSPGHCSLEIGFA